MLRAAIVVSLLGLLALSALGADPVDATVCDVLANPASFDGKTIRLTNATVVAGFDEFAIEGSACDGGGAIWLAYPAGTKAKAGPAAFLRMQLAKNSTAAAEAQNRPAVTLQKNKDFQKFDSSLAKPFKSSAACLACPRNKVTATLIGRLDGASAAGLVRDANGAVTGVAGFGNMNLYRARLVLQSVADVAPREIDYSAAATAVNGDARRAGQPASAERFRRATAAFGEEGEQNGVMVGFGVGNEVPEGEGAKGADVSPDGVLWHLSFDMNRIGQELLPKALAHMGAHIADLRGGQSPALDAAEARAWQVTFTQ